MNRANNRTIPRGSLQKVYDIARRAVAEEKYRQQLDPETGEPVGEYKRLEEAFESVRTFFGLNDDHTPWPR